MPDTTALRIKLKEYQALPQDEASFMIRINWTDDNPPPLLMRRCHECGKTTTPWQMTWSAVEFELDHGRDIPDELPTLCSDCAPEDSDED